MRRVIGSLFLVIILSSLVVASSTTVSFTIKNNSEIRLESHEFPDTSTSYGFYLIGALFILVVGFLILKSRKKKLSKKSITKKKQLVKKKTVSKKK